VGKHNQVTVGVDRDPQKIKRDKIVSYKIEARGRVYLRPMAKANMEDMFLVKK
jgi:hypothetical protein